MMCPLQRHIALIQYGIDLNSEGRELQDAIRSLRGGCASPWSRGENAQLPGHLEARKIVELAKGILRRDLLLTEYNACLILQREPALVSRSAIQE
jgi:hypothetical protein